MGEMNKEEVTKIIEEVIKSLKEKPNQFTFDVKVNIDNITGMTVQGGAGGPGAIGTSIGGGTGIHAQASIGDTEIQIANKAADEDIKQEIQSAVNLLEKLKSEISQKQINKSIVQSILEEFKINKVLSGMIYSVLGGLVLRSI